MKEIRLPELLNIADTAAHDGICDLWSQKTIHLLVIFTSSDQDFEIIGVGPTLPFTTLEAATAHSIPSKKPEFYVKCPAAIAERLQPKLAPSLTRPATRPPVDPALVPSLKGRTTAPFLRPALKMPPKASSKEPGAVSGETVPTPIATPTAIPSPALASPAQAVPIAIEQAKPANSLSIEEREHAITRREHELAALMASLKIREAALRDRETAVAASEERLLNLPTKTD